MAKLIIIRGNSGSGKSTVAQLLQHVLGAGVMLVGQDEIRRNILNVRDQPNNLAIQLIEDIVNYGIVHCDYVILEGILNKSKYGSMIDNLMNQMNVETHTYYFNLSFQETVRRHNLKPDTDFGPEAMANWFLKNDVLGVKNEKCISQAMSENEIVKMILVDII
ncbi:kinase [Staphylococcus edaphicus]|uniref:Kinase n=1 Tax=Staphylococcus edaphicus TaxID=1955013 RepID=A0A2C6WM41_9STAP|nr:kinase [Staphylococcus edaphicus]PHK49439.1 hypothetical protein BTJ66_08260 [Staphylococcus edaphicus]UQW81263.1 kinase [Staphylococcus edaphicus]